MGVFDGWISGIQANGLRGVLRDLFSVHQRQTITVPVFQGALEDSLGRSLQDFFDTYVYGRGSKSVSDITTVDGPQVSLTGSRHPRPFTQEELVRLR
jgi:aminopeptidase N